MSGRRALFGNHMDLGDSKQDLNPVQKHSSWARYDRALEGPVARQRFGSIFASFALIFAD